MPSATRNHALLLLLLGLAVVGCAPEERAELPPPVAVQGPVRANDAKPESAAVAREGYVGVVSPSRAFDLATKTGGVLKTVDVDVGDRVDAAESIAVFDDRDERQEIALARARRRALAATVKESQVDVSRARSGLAATEELAGDGYLSKDSEEQARFDVERSSAASERALAELAASNESLDLLVRRVDRMRVVAPWDAVVVRRYHEPGEFVSAGAPIVQLLRRGPTRVRFAVPPDEVNELDRGSEVHCETPGADKIRAHVRSIAPSVDPVLGLVIVEAELSDPSQDLRPGAPVVVRPSDERRLNRNSQ